MKNFIIILILQISFCVFSQENKVTISIEGISEIVNTTEGKTAKENYISVLEWVKKTYKNPDYVIKAQIEDSYIRFSGYDYFKAKNQPGQIRLEYLVAIEFKENRFKVSFLDVTYHGKTVPKSLYKANGEERKDKYYISSKLEIERLLSEMNQKIYEVCTIKSDW